MPSFFWKDLRICSFRLDGCHCGRKKEEMCHRPQTAFLRRVWRLKLVSPALERLGKRTALSSKLAWAASEFQVSLGCSSLCVAGVGAPRLLCCAACRVVPHSA